MKVALIGASWFVGSALLTELLNRGHQVTAIVRNPEKITTNSSSLTVKEGDVLNSQSIAPLIKDQDAVVSAYNPGWTNPHIYTEFLQGSKSIQEAAKSTGVKRLITVGGAGSLFVAPGVKLIESPDFPAAYKEGAQAASEYLDHIKKENDLDWTFVSPAIEMHPGTSGTRTGSYRKGLDNPVFDEKGRSVLSVEDLAVAIVDELEHPQHIKERFTAAY